MWVNLPDSDVHRIEHALTQHIAYLKGVIESATVEEAKEVLRKEKLKFEGARDRLHEAREDFKKDDPHRAYLISEADDEMEVDEDAVVSPGSDPGAWVHAWIWVTNDQAGVSDEDEDVCRTCGEPYADGGDGFDGECPDCADKTDQKINPENYE